MFKLKSYFMLVLFCGVALTANAEDNANATAKENAAPKPVENKVYDGMVGTWHATSEMMGKKMNEVMKARWAFNHQYLIVDVKAVGVDEPKMKYEGMGVFGVDKDGKAKTFWFDNWGADAASTGTGTFSDNKLEISDSNPMFKEVRTFEIKGKEIVMHAKGTMMPDGKEIPFDVTTVYKKK